MTSLFRTYRTYLVLAIAVCAMALAVWGGYRYYALERSDSATRAELDTATSALRDARAAYTELERKLAAEQEKNSTFEKQIKNISSTVGVLDKLAQTDEELLAKYSKVYFLSEHYAPQSLALIDERFVYPPGKELQLHVQVLPKLESMLQAAKDDGVDLLVLSAFRSFSEQSALKNGYRITYGSGANKFSADQGYSEHQLGTTVDFTTATSKGALVGFDQTPASAWLTAHAHEYGFVLSYPKGNTYYQYEPWHWRYVGEKLATRLHQDDAYFYELDQREIDTYLVYLFD